MVGRTAPTEGDPVVGRALPVNDHVAVVGEGGALIQPGCGPERLGQWFGRHHQGIDGDDRPRVTRQRRRPRLGRPHHHVGRNGAAGGAHPRLVRRIARLDFGDRGVLVQRHATALDGEGQAAGEQRRLHGGAVRSERGPEHPVHAHPGLRLRLVEPAQIVLGKTVGQRFGHFGPETGRPAPGCEPHRGCHPWRNGSRCPRTLRWRRLHRLWPAWPGAWTAWHRSRRRGPARRPTWRRAPSTNRRYDPRHRTRPPRPRRPQCATSGRARSASVPSTDR